MILYGNAFPKVEYIEMISSSELKKIFLKYQSSQGNALSSLHGAWQDSFKFSCHNFSVFLHLRILGVLTFLACSVPSGGIVSQ